MVRSFASSPARAFASFGGAVYVGTWGGGILRVATTPVAVTFEGGGVASRDVARRLRRCALRRYCGLWNVQARGRRKDALLRRTARYGHAVGARGLGRALVDRHARRERSRSTPAALVGERATRTFAPSPWPEELAGGYYGAGLMTSGAHFQPFQRSRRLASFKPSAPAARDYALVRLRARTPPVTLGDGRSSRSVGSRRTTSPRSSVTAIACGSARTIAEWPSSRMARGAASARGSSMRASTR